MRRLLLLLLTFLLPLQLLAATVGELPPHAAQGMRSAGLSCPQVQQAPVAVGADLVADLAAMSPEGGDEDDIDAPVAQAELEDHTIPASIATPDIPWQPFPHAFAAPLNWPSFVRDQLRPPPLA